MFLFFSVGVTIDNVRCSDQTSMPESCIKSWDNEGQIFCREFFLSPKFFREHFKFLTVGFTDSKRVLLQLVRSQF